MTWARDLELGAAVVVVDGAPPEVRARLDARLLRLHSVWFPTRTELAAWGTCDVPLYVRWIRGGEVEVGPRLHSMWAACFSPVLRGSLQPAGDTRSELRLERAIPRVTATVIGLWWAVLALWMGTLALPQPPGAEDPAGWLPFWGVLAVASTLGPAVGWYGGGRELRGALPWLEQQLAVPVEESA